MKEVSFRYRFQYLGALWNWMQKKVKNSYVNHSANAVPPRLRDTGKSLLPQPQSFLAYEGATWIVPCAHMQNYPLVFRSRVWWLHRYAPWCSIVVGCHGRWIEAVYGRRRVLWEWGTTQRQEKRLSKKQTRTREMDSLPSFSTADLPCPR